MVTPQVKESLTKLEEREAVIEAGHQPALLGGPGFVINKMAAIEKIALLQQATPVMFVGDHDHEQKELTVVHLPSPGPRGLMFSLRVPAAYRMSPLHVIPKPSKDWLKQVNKKISATYHELVAGSTKKNQNLYEQRANDLCKTLETTHAQATTISDWTTHLWLRIVNRVQDTGILFQVFSNSAIRELMLPAFEFLLAEPNRQSLIHALNESAANLEQLGYEPGIGRRAGDYVPFHLECPTKDCNRTRLDPTITAESSRGHTALSATCPKCNTTHVIETKANAPDLADWEQFLSPRVDTRAFLVQSYAPVIIHVGGAGETSYHAQVAPALRAANSIVPIFYRYTRLYYENPWVNRTAHRLVREALNPLSYQELQSFKSAIQNGYHEENLGVVQSLFAASEEYIVETFEKLVRAESQIEKERDNLITRQREETKTSNRKEIQAQIGNLTRRRQVLQTYLSQMFGRFSAERFGQEVSYIWIDTAMSIGPEQHFTRLVSHYQPFTPSSATFFLEEENRPL